MKKIFGMPLALAIIGLLVIGGATAALLQVYVFAAGTADVQQSVTWSDETTEQTFSFDEVDSGSETLDVFTLQNNVGVEAEYEFETKCDDRDYISGNARSTKGTDINWGGQCEGIATRYVEYFDEAGADFSDYEAPENCNVNVTSSDSIQTAVDDASSGDVVCVKAGTYDEDVSINNDITLVALNAPSTANRAVLNGEFRVTTDGVTLKGFKIQPQTTAGSETTAILVGSESYTDVGSFDVVIDSNIIESYDASSSGLTTNGIQVKSYGSTVDGVQVINNWVKGAENSDDKGAAGIKLQADVNNVDVQHNTIQNLNSGWVHGIAVTYSSPESGLPSNVVLEYNTVKDLSGKTYSPDALGVEADGSELTIEKNNFNTEIDITNRDENQDPASVTITALNNWFGTDGIQTLYGDVNADYQTKTDTTLDAGETDKFGVINTFAINLAPGDYTLKSNILPVVEE